MFLKRKIITFFVATALCSCLCGCQNFSLSTKTKDTLGIGTFAVEDVSKQVTNLVVNQMLPDDDLISIIFPENQEAKEKILLENVAKALTSKGYAVEKVLPKRDRQKGDVSVMSAHGTKLTVNLIKLMESDGYFNMAVTLKGIKYYRMYALQDGKLVPVSAWSMQNL